MKTDRFLMAWRERRDIKVGRAPTVASNVHRRVVEKKWAKMSKSERLWPLFFMHRILKMGTVGTEPFSKGNF